MGGLLSSESGEGTTPTSTEVALYGKEEIGRKTSSTFSHLAHYFCPIFAADMAVACAKAIAEIIKIGMDVAERIRATRVRNEHTQHSILYGRYILLENNKKNLRKPTRSARKGRASTARRPESRQPISPARRDRDHDHDHDPQRHRHGIRQHPPTTPILRGAVSL